jgi:hypothetical protein
MRQFKGKWYEHNEEKGNLPSTILTFPATVPKEPSSRER